MEKSILKDVKILTEFLLQTHPMFKWGIHTIISLPDS